ncbi:porin [Noviherbaspirillum saxi]|uniref:Porin n=1 Tax=Noviherbaspirillum saxi TaxID=2320863 RepID=A0A3A3FJH7_9BURK|nr:porin [Noviherbaspirillum saxi]RJF95447.1 porin [Noviherbaspirillum saxi]
MKNTVPALALLGIFGSASAQSAITIYGSVDAGVRNLTNVDAAGGDRLTMGSTGTSMSNRIGFKGVEDLGGGYNAHFVLESGFNSGTGALDAANTLFNRTAAVGLGGSFGSLDFGRQYTVAFRTIAVYEPFSYRFPTITYAVPASAGVRYNNDIQYIGTFGPVTVRAEYALGEQAGTVSGASAKAVGASYTNGPIAFGGAYTQRKPLVGGTFRDNSHFTVGGAYTAGKLRAAVGYADEEQETATVDTTSKYAWGGLTYAISPAISVSGAYYQNKAETAGVSGKRDLYILAGYYSLSKRTSLYAEVDRTKYRDSLVAPPAQTSQTGISVGVNHIF